MNLQRREALKAGGGLGLFGLLAAAGLLTLFHAVTGLWEYSTVQYSWHMVVHMTVNMLVPALCVLGAPFTLIQRASRPREGDALPGLREATLAIEGHEGWQRSDRRHDRHDERRRDDRDDRRGR